MADGTSEKAPPLAGPGASIRAWGRLLQHCNIDGIVTFERPNLRQVQVVLGKRLARAPAQLADGFARAVRRTPDGGLEQVLRTPVRRAVLEAIFWQMPQHFDPKGASGMKTTIRWRITRRPGSAADTYELQIVDGRCRARRGEGK
ncbi:MAG: hypothetical protein E6G05_12615, partial [Actinobacteria bacterium]